ncbi:hypothetical protein D3C80_1787850 [compost metagenome]
MFVLVMGHVLIMILVSAQLVSLANTVISQCLVHFEQLETIIMANWEMITQLQGRS